MALFILYKNQQGKIIFRIQKNVNIRERKKMHGRPFIGLPMPHTFYFFSIASFINEVIGCPADAVAAVSDPHIAVFTPTGAP